MMESAAFFFREPEWQAVLPSTNTALRQRVEAGEELPSGFVLAAVAQTEGRGRYGRRWQSGAGRDLTFSFLYSGRRDATRLASLPMAVALGVTAFLEAAGQDAAVKWPNDVRIRHRKICGILAESVPAGGVARVVLGAGLNVNLTAEQAAGIDQPATSLLIETGREHDIRDVLRSLLPHLASSIATWEESGFAGLRAAWLSRSDLLGAQVEVVDGDTRLAGVMADVGTDGELLVRLADSTIRPIWSGDLVSLSPLPPDSCPCLLTRRA